MRPNGSWTTRRIVPSLQQLVLVKSCDAAEAAAAAAGGLDSDGEQPWRSDELRREIAAGKQQVGPPAWPSSTGSQDMQRP